MSVQRHTGAALSPTHRGSRLLRKLRAILTTLFFIILAAITLQPPQSAPAAPQSPATAPAAAILNTAPNPTIAALLLQLATAEIPDRPRIFNDLAHTGDQRLETTFADFNEGSLYLYTAPGGASVVSCKTMEPDPANPAEKIAPLIDPLTRQPLLDAAGNPLKVSAAVLKEMSPSRRDRILVRDALNLLALSNPDQAARLAAINKAGDSGVQSTLPILQEMLSAEEDAALKSALTESIALLQLTAAGDDPALRTARVSAIASLGELRSLRAQSRLADLRSSEKDPATLAALDAALARIGRWQKTVQWIGHVFSGLSLASILILMALGLAIVFGLMGVINMAHGELMMIGAYATYLTQQAFVAWFPGAFNWYFVLAIPLSFLAAAVVGMILEASVIRFLYGRPLDTLLATLGVSFILIQVIRLIFGDNIAVNSPTWLQGSWEVASDVRLPYNRLFIMLFCILCIGLMYFVVDKTKLGLLLRATTQNRTMAASLGVSTRKIDMLTFGLGSGLAGMAGCALTQVGGVTPDMGQNYVIDSFLVVVVGGVGKLAGAIWSGLGLGMTNKFMEPVTGAVWAKVIVLIIIVAFINWKPSGLFPAKGRLADV